MEEELPLEIQELLSCLEEGVTESVTHILLFQYGRGEGIWKVHVNDTGNYWRMLDIPWAKQWRLRVMRAIGSCRTLREIHLQGTVTSEELEALLTPLQSSSVLENIDLFDPNISLIESEVETDHERISAAERVWTILGNILGTSCTIRALKLNFMRLSDAVVENLASALRGNSNSTLESLSLCLWETPSVAKHVAEIVLAAPKLSDLILRHTGVLADDDVKALSNAVVQKTSLKCLGLGDLQRGGYALLLESLAGEGCNKSIVNLQLHGFIDGLGDCLPIILSSNETLKEVKLNAFHEAQIRATQSRKINQSLCSNSSLTKFCISFMWSYINIEGIDSLREILSGINIKKPIIKLVISTLFRRDLSGSSSVSDVVISSLASIRWLELDMENAGRERVSQVENICEALQSNSTVEEFSIFRARGRNWSPAWKKLFVSLRYNTTITYLSLQESDGVGEDEFKDLMGILQVNMTLKTINLFDTSWEKDGKAALINEALRRNAKQQSYFSILGGFGAKLEFEAAKAGRLFLCGSPRAGKTRLRQTLTRLVRGRSWLGGNFGELLRTKGIEVEILRNDHNMQIAVWDLGGQRIFRTLLDILFPRTNQKFMFLFVFSVYDDARGRVKKNLDESFKTELEEWLRFIASNIQITGATLPKVLVVISHMDKMTVRSGGWAENILKELRAEFQDVLDLCSFENLYQIDTRQTKEVAPLKGFIFDTFDDLLHKSHIVPKVCSQLNSALARRKQFRHRPLWRSRDFYQFCLNSLKEDAIPFRTHEIENDMTVFFEAMTSYLHDTGSIVLIPNSEWIVVDPNWLTNVFLGELISMGHNFQVKDDTRSTPNVATFDSRDGFVSSSVLDQLLSSFIIKHPKVKDLNHKILIDILIQLDLCFKVDSIPEKFFMPTIVCEDARFGGTHFPGNNGARLEWSSPPEYNQDFVGFRVQCKDPKRMSMSAALFPRFQIHDRQKLITEMGVTDKDIICSRYYTHLHMNGHEIMIERSDMLKSYIDVMIKCSKNKSREEAVKYLKEHIIEELQKFCASPKGCPGIALVLGILQTECVKQLIPCESKGTILVKKLVDKLAADILKHLEDIRLESWNESSSTLLNYEHSWPAIPGHLPQEFELANKLLSKSEVESATRKLMENHQLRLTTLDHISQEISQELERAKCVAEVVVEVGSSSSRLVVEERGSSVMQMPVPKYESQSTLGRVLSRIDRLEHNMEEKFEGLQITLQRNLDRIITIQYGFESLLRSFNFKMDKMIGYGESLERSRTPKRPYLSFDNVSIFERAIAKFRVGTPVRLHLMCESLAGPHIVKDQRGLPLCLEKENMEWLRRIYDVSSKMIYYLVKAGLQVTMGLGQAVPELGNLKAELPLAIGVAAVENIDINSSMLSVDIREKMPLEEAWYRLRNVLSAQLENNYTSLFNLYKVKYVDLEQGGYAWLCEQCMTRGLRNRSLECL